jgi:hypothetical protein
VEQFDDIVKINIINGLAYTGLRNENCEGVDTEFLDNPRSFLKESSASAPNPSKVTVGRPSMMVLLNTIMQSKCSWR